MAAKVKKGLATNELRAVKPQPKGSEIAGQRLSGYRKTEWAEAHPTKLQNWGSAPDPGIYRIGAAGMIYEYE